MQISKDRFKDAVTNHYVLLGSIPAKQTDIRSAAGQHICVSVNGYWESYLRTCVVEYFRPRCNEGALRVIRNLLRRQYNLKSSDLPDFFGEFISDKRVSIECFLKNHSQFADGITSIVSNKNKIAHEGRSGVSSYNVSNWLEFISMRIDEFDYAAFR